MLPSSAYCGAASATCHATVVSRRFLTADRFVAGIHQHEATRAVGIFDHAALVNRLTECGCLLVSGYTGDRRDHTDSCLGRVGDHTAARHDTRQNRFRYAEALQYRLRPHHIVDVVQHGSADVADVGHMLRPAGQMPDDERVDGTERQLTRFGTGTRAVHILQQPAQLGATEVGIGDQAGLTADGLIEPLSTQCITETGSTPVLPHDGVVYRLTGLPVPYDSRFALVSDADSGDIAADADFTRNSKLCLQDLVRVMLDPARLRIDLAEFALGHRLYRATLVEQDSARRGSALIE